ncbi:hypothetical protein D3C84_1122830 [compost metagenome]
MNRVTHLMCQCKHAVQVVLVVQQHVWMRAVSTPAISSVALVLVLINIDPVVVEAVLKNFQVIFA